VFLAKMQELGWSPASVGGLTLGADPIVGAIATQSLEYSPHAIDSFLVRKEPKKHGLQKFIEGVADEDTRGLPVVIVDDVCTTGGSTALAINKAREAGMHVIGALCLVDREQGAPQALTMELGCPFESIFTLSELLAAEEQSYIETAVTSAA
jgi:orotate phosphoribosyltransferase